MQIIYLVDLFDSLIFAYLAFSVLYLFVFAVFSLFNRSHRFPAASKFHRILVLFPAYKEDLVIESSIKTFLDQEYPRDYYDVVVISDQMRDETNERLSALPIRLFKIQGENSSKARAMNYAMDCLKDDAYDVIVILDADNTVESDFLDQVNRAYSAGALAIQAHRQGKRLTTDYAIMDAASEGMNNAYFRHGHVSAGLSSALSGSGMAFDYAWFRKNIRTVWTTGEDLELEILLLRQRIPVAFLRKVPVYDEKVQNASSFYKQRGRWLAAQVDCLMRAIRDLPRAIFTGNLDYADKLLQWMMLPRVLLFGFIFLIAFVMSLLNWSWALKWWALFLLLVVTFWIAIPKNISANILKIAAKRIPLLFMLMFFNLFRLTRRSGRVFHTPHGEPIKNAD